MHLNVSRADVEEAERVIGIWDNDPDGGFGPYVWQAIAALRRFTDPRIRLEHCLVSTERMHEMTAESCWCGGRRGGHFVKPLVVTSPFGWDSTATGLVDSQMAVLSEADIAEAYCVSTNPAANLAAEGKMGICTECKMPQNYRAGYQGTCLNQEQGCGGVVLIRSAANR